MNILDFVLAHWREILGVAVLVCGLVLIYINGGCKAFNDETGYYRRY